MWTAIISGIIAAGVGISNAVARKKAMEAQMAAYEAQGEINAENRAEIEAAVAPYLEIGATGLNELAAWDPAEAPEDFEYGKDVSDFLDPSMEFQRTNALNDLEQSASVGGELGSGSTFKALMDRSQDYSMQDYGNSFTRMQSDYDNVYGAYTDKFERDRSLSLDDYNSIIAKVNLGKSGTSSLINGINGTSDVSSEIAGGIGDLTAMGELSTGENISGVLNATGSAIGQGMAGYEDYAAAEAAELAAQLKEQAIQDSTFAAEGMEGYTPYTNSMEGYTPSGITQGNLTGIDDPGEDYTAGNVTSSMEGYTPMYPTGYTGQR